MSKLERNIRNAVAADRFYRSWKTGQFWKVEKNSDPKYVGQNYVIFHRHPGQNLHIQRYALSIDSAVKKILKHELWVMRDQGKEKRG